MAQKPRDDTGDDSSSLFFMLALLVCIIAPWTFAVVWGLLFPGKREAEAVFPKTQDGLRVRHCQTKPMVEKRERQLTEFTSRARLFTKGFAARLAILLLLWCWLIYIFVAIQNVLATSDRYQNFDPYDILKIGSGSSTSEIKKAFRRMSLQYHPDKNSAPEAATTFMLIKKAHDALSDPIGKRNYQKYGNPDGPTRMELGVALPTFSKESQTLVLVLFVMFFILGLPLTFLWCMNSGSGDKCANGVLRTTMEALAEGMEPSMNVRAAQELLLSSDAGASCPAMRSEDAEALAALQKEVMSGGKAGSKAAQEEPLALKARLLFLAHVGRRKDLLTEGLAADLDVLLQTWRRAASSMVDMAAKVGSGDSVVAAAELHRCIVQALDPQAPNSSTTPLLQIPQFDEERVKKFRKGPNKTAGLLSFLELSSAERLAALDGLDPQAVADVEEFVVVAPRVTLASAKVFVEGEDEVCEGDVATLNITLERANTKEGEASGAAHTPYFPTADVPETWVLLFELPGKKATTITSQLAIRGRQATASMRFRVPMPGKCRCSLRVVSSAYAGFDLKETVTFEIKKAADVDVEDDGSGAEEEDDSGSGSDDDVVR